jgi:hypothetical protein
VALVHLQEVQVVRLVLQVVQEVRLVLQEVRLVVVQEVVDNKKK